MSTFRCGVLAYLVGVLGCAGTIKPRVENDNIAIAFEDVAGAFDNVSLIANGVLAPIVNDYGPELEEGLANALADRVTDQLSPLVSRFFSDFLTN